MRNFIFAAVVSALFSVSAFAGYETGAADQVLRVPGAGGRPQYGQVDLSKSAAVKNQLPASKGGTGIDLSASSGIVGVSGGTVSAFTAQQVRAFTATPVTFQRFIATGTTTGYLFTVTAANATVGATYTNNSNTYTVLATISSSTRLFASQASAPQSSGTLTKASGTGDSTITFSSAVAVATYTTPTSPAPLYLKACVMGSGGGGGGGGNGADGTSGGESIFGLDLLRGSGGPFGAKNAGAGGLGTVNATSLSASLIFQNVPGGSGGDGFISVASAYFPGGLGGIGAFGGGGGTNGATNSGAGGQGGSFSGAGNTGAGGASGGYICGVISSPLATYPYRIGAAGGGGAGAGGGGGNAYAGALGAITVEEDYQ